MVQSPIYLCHQDDVHRYLGECELRAEQIRQSIVAKQDDMPEIRERLLARQGNCSV